MWQPGVRQNKISKDHTYLVATNFWSPLDDNDEEEDNENGEQINMQNQQRQQQHQNQTNG
jgi:hypothetical protein